MFVERNLSLMMEIELTTDMVFVPFFLFGTKWKRTVLEALNCMSVMKRCHGMCEVNIVDYDLLFNYVVQFLLN
jgi:hypothetical protein